MEIKKGILKIMNALFSAYLLDLQQSSNPFIQQSMGRYWNKLITTILLTSVVIVLSSCATRPEYSIIKTNLEI